MHRLSITSALLVCLALTSGCKLLVDVVLVPLESASTGALAAVGGSLESISASSGSLPSGADSDDEARQRYMRDLRQYAAVFMRSPGSERDFERGISGIAESYGITHWQAEPATPYAIGQGLAEAGVSAEQMQQLSRRLEPGSATSDWVLAGWRAGQSAP